jgi:hypothetical protein
MESALKLCLRLIRCAADGKGTVHGVVMQCQIAFGDGRDSGESGREG